MYDYKNLKTFTKGQINGLTKHLSNLRFNQGFDNNKMWTAIFKRAEELGLEIGYSEAHGERLNFVKPRKITREQTQFGKKWLKEFYFKKNGEMRIGKRTDWVSNGVLAIAKQVTRFEFVGVQVLASSAWYPSGVVPIYRAYNSKGDYFDYAPRHWENPIVMEG